MSKQRTLILNCTPLETQLRLKLQLSPYLLGGKVEENSFQIPKRPTGFSRTKGSLPSTFFFVGDYHPCGDGSKVTYRVRSGLSAFIVYPLLSLLTLYMLYQFIFAEEPIISVIVSVCFIVFYHLVKQLEKNKCILDFEKQMNTEIHRY